MFLLPASDLLLPLIPRSVAILRTVFAVGDAHLTRLLHRLSLACNAAVLTVDYMSPPDYDRAESLEDLDKAYKWLITQPGVAPAKLFVMADGLGAPLAVSLMINIR